MINEKWEQAQKLERESHHYSKDEGLKIYRESYKQYFEYLDINSDLEGKKIVEIGPADFPALYFCENFEGIVIEPMPSKILEELCNEKNIKISRSLAETYQYDDRIDEVWLFNVLQHVISPEKIISRANLYSKTIRFFEPINYGFDDKHLHNLTLEFFRFWLGIGNVKYYPGNKQAKNFHTHECAYGIWKNM